MPKFSDLDFFFKRNQVSDDLQILEDIKAVSQSIKNIVLTDSNERYFLPNFGADISNELYETHDWRSSIVLEENIRAKLALYEPRIEIKSININYTTDTELLVEIQFFLVDRPQTLTQLILTI